MSATATLERWYRSLDERGLNPEYTPGGRSIVADCPCCGEERGLEIRGAEAPEGRAQ